MKFFASPRRCADAAVLALLVLASFEAARADPMFVIDKVILNVYAEPDQGSGRIATLQTGDAVEASERMDGYVRVRLEDDREGWVRENFLSAEAPAIIRLRALQEGKPAAPPVAAPQLAEEIARLKKQNSALNIELTGLREQVRAQAARPVPAVAAPANPIPEPLAKEPSREATPDMPSASKRTWPWPALTVLSGAIGFLLGYQALASRIRRKYGSVRIY